MDTKVDGPPRETEVTAHQSLYPTAVRLSFLSLTSPTVICLSFVGLLMKRKGKRKTCESRLNPRSSFSYQDLIFFDSPGVSFPLKKDDSKKKPTAQPSVYFMCVGWAVSSFLSSVFISNKRYARHR